MATDRIGMVDKEALSKISENKIETEVCRHALATGWIHYKFAPTSSRGAPDRVFLKNGKTIFIEFKAPGKKPSRFQYGVINLFRASGFPVGIIDDIQEGMKFIDAFTT